LERERLKESLGRRQGALFLAEPFPSKPSPQLMLQLCHAVQSLYLSDSTRLPNGQFLYNKPGT